MFYLTRKLLGQNHKETQYVFSNPSQLNQYSQMQQQMQYKYNPEEVIYYQQEDKDRQKQEQEQLQQKIQALNTNTIPQKANSLILPSAKQDSQTTSDSKSTHDSDTDSTEDSFDREFKAKFMNERDALTDKPIEMSSQKYCENNPGALQFLQVVFRRCNNFSEAQLKNLAGKDKCTNPAARFVRIQFIKCSKLNDKDLTSLGELCGNKLGNIEYLNLEIKGNNRLTQDGVYRFLMGVFAGGNDPKYLRIKVRKCKHLSDKSVNILKCGVMSLWPNLQELVFSFKKNKIYGPLKPVIDFARDVKSIMGYNGGDKNATKKINGLAQQKIFSLGLQEGQLYSETTVVYFNRVFSNKTDKEGKPIKLGGRQ